MKIIKYNRDFIRTLSPFLWMLIGFLLHAFGLFFAVSNKTACYFFCGLGLIVIFYNAIFKIKCYVHPLTSLTRLLFYCYLFWNFIILLSPFFNSYPITGFSPVDKYQWLSFLLPLFLFLGISNFNIQDIFRIGYLSGIIGLVLFVIYFKDIFTANVSLNFEEYQEYIGKAGIPTFFLAIDAFLVLFYSFMTRKQKILSFISWSLVLVTMMFTARRGGIFSFILILLFALYLYVFYSGKSSKFLKLIFVFSIIGFSILIYFLYAETAFSLLTARLGEDSRTGVEEYFFNSFKGNAFDWFFGRGLNGTYYCPLFDNPQRSIIETGYLYLILKGGIVNLAFYLFFLGRSAFLGLFKSKNKLLKGMALYLLAHIIFLYPFGVPSFDIEYLLVWVFVLYCHSKSWRSKTDSQIKELISLT